MATLGRTSDGTSDAPPFRAMPGFATEGMSDLMKDRLSSLLERVQKDEAPGKGDAALGDVAATVASLRSVESKAPLGKAVMLHELASQVGDPLKRGGHLGILLVRFMFSLAFLLAPSLHECVGHEIVPRTDKCYESSEGPKGVVLFRAKTRELGIRRGV